MLFVIPCTQWVHGEQFNGNICSLFFLAGGVVNTMPYTFEKIAYKKKPVGDLRLLFYNS